MDTHRTKKQFIYDSSLPLDIPYSGEQKGHRNLSKSLDALFHDTDIIENVDFYKSGFPARYGGRMSSIVEGKNLLQPCHAPQLDRCAFRFTPENKLTGSIYYGNDHFRVGFDYVNEKDGQPVSEEDKVAEQDHRQPDI